RNFFIENVLTARIFRQHRVDQFAESHAAADAVVEPEHEVGQPLEAHAAAQFAANEGLDLVQFVHRGGGVFVAAEARDEHGGVAQVAADGDGGHRHQAQGLAVDLPLQDVGDLPLQ